MTQLLIEGRQAALPDGFSITLKRENPFFTKSGEYTYDITLSLEEPANASLYGFLGRVNRSGQFSQGRQAVLMSDAHVLCRGTEVITGWTASEVTIQVVGGNAELNALASEELLIQDLDMGCAPERFVRSAIATYPEYDFCQPMIRAEEGVYNYWSAGGFFAGARTGSGLGTSERLCPFLCAMLRRMFAALGYELRTNQLEQTPLRNLFIVNTVFTKEYARMLPGWTVRDFLTEVERLCNATIIIDAESRTADILLKPTYYVQAPILPLRNITDEYEAETSEASEDFSSSNLAYDMPDHYWKNLMQLPEGYLDEAEVVDCDSLQAVLAYGDAGGKVLHDTSTGRYYARVSRTVSNIQAHVYFELNQFCRLQRDEAAADMEMKISPAPMAYLGYNHVEIIDIGSSDHYQKKASGSGSDDDDADDGKPIDQLIRDYRKETIRQADLYVAFNNGTTVRLTDAQGRQGASMPVVYTDDYHALQQTGLIPERPLQPITGTPEGSLRLQDLDAVLSGDAYRIDTTRSYTFETFDANTVDPRSLLVIRGRRFVVRDIEETITAYGRQPLWHITCHPIEITDEAFEQRWVLTRGIWDDGGAWIDDGRWND